MINNLLKVVGVESSSIDDNNSYAASSTADLPYAANIDDSNNNLASTIGGIFSTIQETFQLDGKGVVSGAHLLVPGSGSGIGGSHSGGISVGAGIGFGRSSGGRSKNVSARGYYTDVTHERRRREAAAAVGVPQLLSGMGVSVGVGGSGGDSNVSQTNQQQRGKANNETFRPIIVPNGVYQGRKIVSDVNHLYDVVNDKEAHENYDTLMEIIANTTAAADSNDVDDQDRLSDISGGSSHHDSGIVGPRRDHGRRCANSRGNSLERKLMWARLKEEEVVDRMLSQFPEFGTNLPTLYTVVDEDDNNDDDDEEFDTNNSLRRSRGGSKISSDGAANITSTSNNDNNNPSSPTIRTFTDDASDIFGRFFFGIPNSGGSTTNSNANNAEGRGDSRSNVSVVGGGDEFQRTSSFGSASTLSTMTASASTNRAAAPSVGGSIKREKQRGGDLNNSVPPSDGSKLDANNALGGNDDVGYSSGWDQDEIDLWTTKSAQPKTPSAASTRHLRVVSVTPEAGSGSKLQAKALSSASLPQRGSINNEGLTVEDNWASRRRLYRQRHKKRLDWNSLKNSHSGLSPSAVALALPTPTIVSPHRSQHSLPQIKKDKDPQQASQQYDRAKSGRAGAIIVDNEKQHWMPDNICKHCYSCEAPFTLIRRKHHCRLCGMIFCSSCSAYFVQISSSESDTESSGISSDGLSSSNKPHGGNGAQGTIRTCRLCYDHLSERGLGVVMRGNKLDYGNGTLQRKPSSEASARTADASNMPLTPATPSILRKDSTGNIRISSDAKPEVVKHASTAISPSDLADQFACFQGEEGVSLSGDFHALSITKQRLEEERRKREEHERAELEEAARLAAAEEEAKEAELSGVGGGSSFRLKSQLGTVRQLIWNGSLVINSSSNVEDGGQKSGVDSNALEPVNVSVGDGSAMATSNAKMPHSGDVSGPHLHQHSTFDISGAIPRLESSARIEGAILFEPGQSDDAKTSAKIHLGKVAADYLEKITRELLLTDAPLLLEEIKTACTESSSPAIEQKMIDLWVNTLMSLATRCCSVEPDVKKGDFLDIRPYCKVKTIPGGTVLDSAQLSGVMFHKSVAHKKMARVIMNAKIMMLRGGIEYTRTENRIASLDTLLEQEERYMEILVSKIFKVQPNIIIVGKSVCRKAQELLLRANIVLIQYVKPALMTRIARQTGATVVSSIDHVINSSLLGRCRRFRLVSFRDNDVWVDDKEPSKVISSDQKSVPVLLSQDIPNHERQAALAAQKLGERVFDGMEAVTVGLAKRGVVQTYSMIEGCPKELGCTVILRGASRPALKMVKRVCQFLINCSYNMKLETSYILERCCRLPPTYEIPPTPCCSSSLCVDFGSPPNNRKARPWNGGKNDPTQRSISGKITPLDHQAILITSVWMTDKTQCCPAEVKGICYYSMQDVSLGQFLRDSCFNLSLKCQNPSCKKSVIDHSLSFIHNDGMINISVERMDNPIPKSSLKKQHQKDTISTTDSKSESALDYEPIATWTYCTKCSQVVTPLIYLSKQTWQWSFGKFLEVYFYNRDAIINAPGHLCSCRMQTSSQLFFGCGNLAARFTYEKISPYSVFCRRHLPFDESFHRAHALQDLEHISATSTSLFLKYDKQIDAITRETRELFGSALNKPEHLQAVLSELNLVSAEVDNASKVLQEKIASVTAKFSKGDTKRTEYNEVLLHNFPWYSRRYIFMLASAWNERLSAAGNALTAMKKIQNTGGTGRGDSAAAPAVVGDASTDDVVEGMKRIRILQESYSKNYNVTKMTMPRSGEQVGLFEGNILPDGRVATWEEEAEMDEEEFYSDPENDIDFEDDVDADVLASRNRVYSNHTQASRPSTSRQQTKVSSAGRRSSDRSDEFSPVSDQSPGPNPIGYANNYDSSGQLESQGKAKTVTAGGAVKSALNRFFNRGGNKEDPYVVDLGFFGKGRPRLQPGIGGLVIPVFDDQPSTIISHSLASAEYDVQFKHFLSAAAHPESRSEKNESSRSDLERRMLGRNKSHIKHTFRDFDEKGQQLCKFVCTTFWSVQFDAVRQAFMNPQTSSKDSSGGETKATGQNKLDVENSYIRSLATSFSWAASGGKSGAAFSRTTDDRFVIKSISRTELQMFLDCAPAYFEYLNKAFFHGLPTVLCKIVGVYQIGYHNRVTGRRTMEQVAVMQNIFYGRKISKIFDLKGSLRGRFTRQANLNKEKRVSNESSQYRRSKSDTTSDSESLSSGDEDDDDTLSTSSGGMEKDDSDKGEKTDKGASIPTLLDGDFLEFTSGRPLPLTDRAKAVFHMSILNDTLFLSIINVLDYSILVGIDEEKKELVVGIIDFMRQYDILKQMERVGKSLPMVVGSEAPTIIQPPLYKARFTNAMERYFMTVPSKWTTV